MREEYMDKWIDHYKNLEIQYPSNETEIKKAHRILSKKYHPDMNQNNEEAEKKFKKAQKAYEILSSPFRKKDYDFYYELKMEKMQDETKKGQNYSNTSTPTKKYVTTLIKEASTLEEIANIWKYIDKNFQNFPNEKEQCTQLIKEKLPHTIFGNPFFYKQYINYEKEEADEKLQLYFYKMKCILTLYDNISLYETINLNEETQINKEVYFQDLIQNALNMLINITSAFYIKSNTIHTFYHILLSFTYFMAQTNNQAKLRLIAKNSLKVDNQDLQYLINSFEKKLISFQKILDLNIVDFYEEITVAVEKNSPLHYAIAYDCLKYLSKNTIKFEKVKSILYDVRKKLGKNPFNLYEFTLLNQLLIEFNDYKKLKQLNRLIYAITTALDNENLENDLDKYHNKFYNTLCALPLTDLEEDARESIQQLFSIYSSFYSQETIHTFYYNTNDLKR